MGGQTDEGIDRHKLGQTDGGLCRWRRREILKNENTDGETDRHGEKENG
jgi:hypothetical protein